MLLVRSMDGEKGVDLMLKVSSSVCPVAVPIFRRSLMRSKQGRIHNAEIAVVISNNPDAYALERAKKAWY